MNPSNILFLTENLADGGHSEDLLRCIQNLATNTSIINFKEDFFRLGRQSLLNKIIYTVLEHNVDTVFVNLGTGGILTPLDINSIRGLRKIRIIVIFGDSEHNFESHDRYYAQVADLNWILCPSAVGLFELYGFRSYCRQPFSEKYYDFKDDDKIYDVSFVGGIDRADRASFLSHLEHEPGIKSYIAGYGSKIGLVSVEEKNRIIKSSKIHLNFTRVVNSSRSIFQHVRQTKGRPLECALLGTFILSEKSPGLNDLFPEVCFDTFCTPKEMIEKIKFYLLNEALREEMVRKALIYSKAYKSKAVALELAAEIRTLPAKHPPIFLDADFCRFIQNSAFYHFWFFAIRFQIINSLQALVVLRTHKYFNILDFIHQGLRAIFHRLAR